MNAKKQDKTALAEKLTLKVVQAKTKSDKTKTVPASNIFVKDLDIRLLMPTIKQNGYSVKLLKIGADSYEVLVLSFKGKLNKIDKDGNTVRDDEGKIVKIDYSEQINTIYTFEADPTTGQYACTDSKRSFPDGFGSSLKIKITKSLGKLPIIMMARLSMIDQDAALDIFADTFMSAFVMVETEAQQLSRYFAGMAKHRQELAPLTPQQFVSYFAVEDKIQVDPTAFDPNAVF